MIALFLSGCLQKTETIRHTQPYDKLIGSVYQSLVPLYLYGVTLDPNYKQVTSAYSLRTPPGKISGPEVVSMVKLPVGTIVKVYDVQRCTNCFIWSPITLMVNILSYEEALNFPISLYTAIEETDSGKGMILNPEFFQLVRLEE